MPNPWYSGQCSLKKPSDTLCHQWIPLRRHSDYRARSYQELRTRPTDDLYGQAAHWLLPGAVRLLPRARGYLGQRPKQESIANWLWLSRLPVNSGLSRRAMSLQIFEHQLPQAAMPAALLATGSTVAVPSAPLV